jgi:hypothetical protein
MRTVFGGERFLSAGRPRFVAPRSRIVKIIRSIEAWDTRAIRVVMASAGLTLVAATLSTSVVSFLLALATLMACGTMLEVNERRGAYQPVPGKIGNQLRPIRRVNPRR